MAWVKLSDVCELITDGTHNTPKLEETGIPLFDGADIDKMRIYNDSPRKFISIETDEELSIRCKPKTDDVLISSRGSIGKIAIVLPSQNFNIMGNIILCRPKKGQLSPSYLAYNMLHKNADLQKTSHGSSQKGLYLSQVRNIEIPLPPLETQKKIAAVLDKAQELIDKRKEQLVKLDEFVQSVFLEMFGDPVLNGKRWRKVKLKDIAKVKIGPFGSLLHAEDYVKGGIPLINPSHIVKGKISIDTDMTISDEKAKELKSYRMESGNVVLGRRGEIGRCAVVGEREDGFLCGTGSMFISPTEVLHPVYLAFLLSSTAMRTILENNAKGITMKNLNSGVLENIVLNLPPLDLQNQFAAIVEKTEQQKALMQQSLAEMENNFNSLMQQAFKGELF